MDEHNSKYPRMDWDAKYLPLEFKSFKEHCNFMFGGPLKSKSEEEKCNHVMLWAGEKGCNIYSTWTLTNEERKQLEIHYEKFENYCKPKSNKIYSRYIFMRREQGTDEPFEQFVTDLKLLYKEWGYDHAMEDEMIKDHIVFGIKLTKVREKLINEGNDLTLEKSMDISRPYELFQKQLKLMNSGEDPNVHAIRSKFPTKQRSVRKQEKKKSSGDKSTYEKQAVKCMKCGYTHSDKQCLAMGKKCRSCHKLNHFSKMRLLRKGQKKSHRKGIHSLDDCDSSSSDNADYDSYNSDNTDYDYDSYDYKDIVYVKMLTEENDIHRLSDDWTIKSIIYDDEIQMQIDTGARYNVISQNVLKQMKIKTALKKTESRSYSGHTTKPLRSIKLPCYFNNNIYEIEFQVIEQNATTILGSQTCQKIGLIQVIYNVEKSVENTENRDIQNEYSDLFHGIGRLPGKHKIHTDHNVTPVVHPPRRLPISMRDKVKDEL